MNSSLEQLVEEIKSFRDARNWGQFHDARNLATCLSVESAELLELYLWNREVELHRVKEELADVFYSALLLSDYYGFDVFEIVREKLRQNELKYPVDKALDNNDKYNRL